MRAFVTGATGFLGRHLIEHLLAQGDEVTALVRTFDRARALPRGVRTWAGDVTRPEALRAGVRGAEVVYHLAAARQPGRRARDLARLERINVEGTRAVLALAGELGAGRVVYVSDLAVHEQSEGGEAGGGGQPQVRERDEQWVRPYVASKRRAHAAAVEAMRDGVPVSIVCPGALVGAGDAGWLGRLLGRYARGRLWVGMGGESAYGFVSVREAARGLRLAAVRGAAGETYDLPGPGLTLRQFFKEAEAATGLPAPVLWLPSALARLAGRALGGLRPDLAEAASHFAGGVTAGDAGKAERELGWRASPLADALREAVAWHQEQERAAREAEKTAREPEAGQ